MNRITRRTTLAAMTACAVALALPAAAQPKAGEPLKIGFVYVSPIGDAGWTFQHDTGRKEMEKALGAKVTTKYIESVPEGSDAERVIRELAATGHNLIFTTSFGYMNPTIKVAQTFPNHKFEHATGYKTSKNVGIYNARFYEGRYLAGIVAGKMSKTNVAGYVAAFPIPEVVMGINAFARGMRSVNPKAEVKVIWVNSLVRPGQGVGSGEHADLATGRRGDAPHRLDRGRAGSGGEEGLRDRLSLRHVEIRPERAAHRGDAPLGRLLHEGGPVRRRRQVEAGQRLGRHQGRHDQARAVQQGRAGRRAGAGEEGRRRRWSRASSIRSPAR